MFDLRKWENMHIPLWLVKDTCWMMEWRWLGVLMVVPTVSMAVYILIKTAGKNEFFLNLSICFWISANSFWMCAEFFDFIEYKFFAGIPFILGMASIALFYYKQSKSLHSDN